MNAITVKEAKDYFIKLIEELDKLDPDTKFLMSLHNEKYDFSFDLTDLKLEGIFRDIDYNNWTTDKFVTFSNKYDSDKGWQIFP